MSRVRISALALLKMAMHARSGGNLEIMGMLQVCKPYWRPTTNPCLESPALSLEKTYRVTGPMLNLSYWRATLCQR